MKRLLLLLLVLCSLPARAEDNRAKLAIAIEPLGDSPAGVVARTTFRFVTPADVPQGVPLAIIGSVVQGGSAKHFRYLLSPEQRTELSSTLTFALGEAEIEARLMIPLEEQTPILLGKAATRFTFAPLQRPFAAGEGATAEAIVAEGTLPAAADAVRIVPPRRDLAPNLFIVEVDVKPPVRRVEFWVEGKKLMSRNAPPYRAELDLGALPRRVEVRAVGYDAKGRYVDADAFVVNEREMPLEAKITRTVTPDGISHFKVSVQNSKGSAIKSVTLYAGQKKLVEWKQPPYAVDIPSERLKGVEFVRVAVLDEKNHEAGDLLFLSGERYLEKIDVNVVELPLSVTDATGAVVTDLKASEIQVFEDGRRQKIAQLARSADLPLSIGLLIDHSGSMKPRMEATKGAAVEFLKRVIKRQDRAFVAAFAFDPEKLAPFTSDVASLERQVGAIPEAAGGTSLYDAIITGLYRFRAMEGRRALVILSDGADTTSRVPYEDLLTYVRAARVPLYFIGVGMRFDDFAGSARMKALAAESGAATYFISHVKDLPQAYGRLEADLRSQYLATYYPEAAGHDKYRVIEVKVDRPNVKVRTIRGYIP